MPPCSLSSAVLGPTLFHKTCSLLCSAKGEFFHHPPATGFAWSSPDIWGSPSDGERLQIICNKSYVDVVGLSHPRVCSRMHSLFPAPPSPSTGLYSPFLWLWDWCATYCANEAPIPSGDDVRWQSALLRRWSEVLDVGRVMLAVWLHLALWRSLGRGIVCWLRATQNAQSETVGNGDYSCLVNRREVYFLFFCNCLRLAENYFERN